MPKNMKSKKNSEKHEDASSKNRELVLKKDLEGTIYGKTSKILGDCNFMVFCFDGTERLCHIRKSIKRGEKVMVDTIVLVGLRDYQDSKGDIVYVYSRDQEMLLRRTNEIPDTSNGDQFDTNENVDETGFDFNEI